jgi:hypothetical protein
MPRIGSTQLPHQFRLGKERGDCIVYSTIAKWGKVIAITERAR